MSTVKLLGLFTPMKRSTVVYLALIACGGCGQRSTTSPTDTASVESQARDAQTTQLREKLKGVTVADGISKTEAELIAECYFHQNVGCGAFTGIQDGGDFWIVDAKFGYAATPVKGFHIDKNSGKIKSPIGPSYANPFEIFP